MPRSVVRVSHGDIFYNVFEDIVETLINLISGYNMCGQGSALGKTDGIAWQR